MMQCETPTSLHTVRWEGAAFEHLVPTANVSDQSFIAAAGYAGRSLPSAVHDALCDFADTPPESGALLVRGVPIGELPRTPETPSARLNKSRWTEFVLLAVARRLGHPVGYLPEHNGDVVQNIVPTKNSADRQVSTSSKAQLEFHTEAAFHPHRPRYLLLACLRSDPLAATTLCSVRDAVRVLSAETIDILRSERFATGVDESYLGRRSDQVGSRMSVVSGSPGAECICFDGDLMRGLDAQAAEALDALRNAVARTQTAVVLQAGDMLVIDNTIAVHGRTPFTPRFDGTDRWLQRTFVVADLAPSASDRTGRIISTAFDV